MITALLGAGLLARARAAVTGPIAGALAVALVAVVVAGSIGLGLWWLRGDAARDAGAACDKAQLEADLAAANARAAALDTANAERSAAMANMQRQAQLDAEMIGELVRAKGEAEDAAKKADEAAGRAGVVFRADDAWLRARRAAAAARGAAPGR